MTKIHETVSGHRIEYEDDDPKVARFLKRVQALVDDKKATEDDVIALAYGRENPFLEHHAVFPDRGAVTKAVSENPVYHVLLDLLFRKRVQIDGTDIDRLAAKFSLTLEEAAARRRVTVDGLRKAIKDRRLPSWIKEGKPYLDPRSLETFELGTRGRHSQAAKPLEYFVGHDAAEGGFARIWTDWDGELADPPRGTTNPRWQKAVLLTGGRGGKLRLFRLKPAAEGNELKFGVFFVRGEFEIVEKVNAPKAAREAWEEVTAS